MAQSRHRCNGRPSLLRCEQETTQGFEHFVGWRLEVGKKRRLSLPKNKPWCVTPDHMLPWEYVCAFSIGMGSGLFYVRRGGHLARHNEKDTFSVPLRRPLSSTNARGHQRNGIFVLSLSSRARNTFARVSKQFLTVSDSTASWMMEHLEYVSRCGSVSSHMTTSIA